MTSDFVPDSVLSHCMCADGFASTSLGRATKMLVGRCSVRSHILLSRRKAAITWAKKKANVACLARTFVWFWVSFECVQID